MAGFPKVEMKMAPNKRIFALILIKIIATSSATRDKIVAEESIQLSELGERTADDHLAFAKVINMPARSFGMRISKELHFRTWNNEIITQVLIQDPHIMPVTPGVRFERIHHGPGFQDVTLKFFGIPNTGMTKVVTLYGRHPTDQA